MAKRQVIQTECDRCHHENVTPLEKVKYARRDALDLPKGWLHVSGQTATSTVFEIDLCPECKGSVLEAAGASRLRVV